jgi:hypothetical protein
VPGRPLGYRDPDLFGKVGQLLAGGRLDVDRVHGLSQVGFADAQFGDPGALLFDPLAAGLI